MRQRNYTHQIKSHKNVAWFFVFFFSVCSSAHASHIVRAPFHFPASRVQTQEFSHYDYVARYALYNTLYNNPFQHFSISVTFFFVAFFPRLLFQFAQPTRRLSLQFFSTATWHCTDTEILHNSPCYTLENNIHNITWSQPTGPCDVRVRTESISKCKRKQVKCDRAHRYSAHQLWETQEMILGSEKAIYD